MYCFFLPEIWSFFYKGQEPHISKFDRLPPPGNTVEFYDITEDPMEEEPSNVTEIDLTTGSGDEPPGDQQKILAVFRPWPERFLTFDIRIDDSFTPVALQFLSDCVIGWHEEIQEIHIYTDGSFDRRQDVSSYAFAVYGWSPSSTDKHFFLGWSGGIVTTDSSDKTYIGATSHSAGDGEVSAIPWALLWILQSPYWCEYYIHFDSTVAGYTASGDWQYDDGNLHKSKNEGSGTVGWINAARYGALFTCEGPQQPSLQRPGGWICEAKDRARSKHASLYTGLEAALS